MTQDDTVPNGNTTRNIRARIWSITINNYTVEDMTQLTELTQSCSYYVWQEEVGENNTPHIQGHLEFKNPRTLNSLKNKLPRAHLEKCRNVEASRKYCEKSESRLVGTITRKHEVVSFRDNLVKKVLKKYDNIVWKNWQQNILNKIAETPDDRTVNWYWEPTGKVGKSFLALYIVATYKAVIADGKKDNVFNQINCAIDSNIEPSIIIIDLPRHNVEYLNYGMIEQIKNGMIYSGKYEGGVCIFPNPHVFIFANEPPNMNKFSRDRWNIVDLQPTHGVQGQDPDLGIV